MIIIKFYWIVIGYVDHTGRVKSEKYNSYNPIDLIQYIQLYSDRLSIHKTSLLILWAHKPKVNLYDLHAYNTYNIYILSYIRIVSYFFFNVKVILLGIWDVSRIERNLILYER